MNIIFGNDMNINLENGVNSFFQPRIVQNFSEWVTGGVAKNLDLLDCYQKFSIGVWQTLSVPLRTVFSFDGVKEESLARRSACLMTKLRQAYSVLEETGEVSDFLSKNTYLIPILNEAVPHLYSIFGENVTMNVTFFNLSGEEDYGMLFVHINTSFEPDLAVDSLDQFLEEWFLDKMVETNGKLGFDVKIMEG